MFGKRPTNYKLTQTRKKWGLKEEYRCNVLIIQNMNFWCNLSIGSWI